jgi:multisubunit Na+/H+ antiporter MnhE subunit
MGFANFSISTLIAGFVFGIFGLFIFRQGKREANIRRIMLGISLMAYGYFVTNPWLNWMAGSALLAVNYYSSWAAS